MELRTAPGLRFPTQFPTDQENQQRWSDAHCKPEAPGRERLSFEQWQGELPASEDECPDGNGQPSAEDTGRIEDGQGPSAGSLREDLGDQCGCHGPFLADTHRH